MATYPLSKLQYSLRGNFLASTIEIERKIDDYLSTYFCDTLIKKNELCELLLFNERVTLESKKDIFQGLLKFHNKDFLKSNPNFLDDLNNFSKHRNIFAHLELEEDGSQTSITFKRYKAGKMALIVYDIDLINAIGVQAIRINNLIDELLRNMPPLS